MKTLKIHLIRHGLTDANILGEYIGSRTDLPISPESLNELKFLRENFEYPQIDAVYSSPMLRCKQTAAVLFPDFSPTCVENLTEYDFGDFEGKTAAELENNPDFLDWASGKISATPNGEDNNDFLKRLCVGLNQIVLDMIEKDIESSAVIMHGGAIMMLLAATAVPRRHPAEWTSEAGHGYSLLITPSLYHKSGVVEVTHII